MSRLQSHCLAASSYYFSNSLINLLICRIGLADYQSGKALTHTISADTRVVNQFMF
jgi:hypothetical protein